MGKLDSEYMMRQKYTSNSGENQRPADDMQQRYPERKPMYDVSDLDH